MKTINIILLVIVVSIVSKVNAQNDTVRIQTSAICEQCKVQIENDLSFEKGVKSSNLDLKTKMITVIYNHETDAEKIRIAITKIGYDADSLKAFSKDYKKLPDCCKNTGMK